MPNKIAVTHSIINMLPIQTAKPIHNGQVTHHHDHVIAPVSFKIKNTMNIVIDKLLPLFVVELILYFLIFLISFYVKTVQYLQLVLTLMFSHCLF